MRDVYKIKNGFTLIELLVVISVIGLLSTLAVIGLDNSRKKARDARRVSDMKQIQTAIEMYTNDHGGKYFSTGGTTRCLGIPSTEQCWGGFTGDDALNAALTPYLSKIPVDPLYGTRSYNTYIYQSPGTNAYPGFTDSGLYAIAFAPDESPDASPELCLGWTWGAYDNTLHCTGGYCRQCGYMGK